MALKGNKMVHKICKLSLIALVGTFILTFPAACTDRTVNYSFSFGGYGENEGIEVLNYRYSGPNLTPIAPPDWAVKSGHIGQGAGVGGFMPVGDALYVKWRVEATDKVYEDNVNLKGLLPWDMTNNRVTFIVKGSQLYVYLISPHGHKPEGPECPVHTYRDFGCTELYPEHWQNF